MLVSQVSKQQNRTLTTPSAVLRIRTGPQPHEGAKRFPLEGFEALTSNLPSQLKVGFPAVSQTIAAITTEKPARKTQTQRRALQGRGVPHFIRVSLGHRAIGHRTRLDCKSQDSGPPRGSKTVQSKWFGPAHLRSYKASNARIPKKNFLY